MMRQLQPGEVGVSFLDGAERNILPESDLRLIDRTIPPGDFCKRSIDDVRSGVVINTRVKGRLEHAISGEPVEGWKTLEDLESRADAEIGDYVVYDDWIGQVCALSYCPKHTLIAGPGDGGMTDLRNINGILQYTFSYSTNRSYRLLRVKSFGFLNLVLVSLWVRRAMSVGLYIHSMLLYD
jgi:hypothetical protein